MKPLGQIWPLDREDEESGLPCREKLPFTMPEAAEAAAAWVEWRYGAKPKVYHCRYCERWHLSGG